MLLQKNSDGFEQTIAFMSKALRGVELKYTAMEKQWCALVQVVKWFREYIWNAKVTAYLPHPTVK